MKPATDLIDLLRSRVGQRYVLGMKAPKDDPTWAGPWDRADTKPKKGWDCAELLSWGVFQLTAQLVGCSGTDPHTADAYSGHWASQAEAADAWSYGGPLTPEALLDVGVGIAIATPGAVLVRTPGAPGLSGHVALSTGGGKTIEAYDSDHGVIEGKSVGRRWDYGVVVPGLAYDVRAPMAVVVPSVMRIGAKGDSVRRVQARLKALGFPVTVDGDYGPKTAAAVADFQRAKHLVADGEAGPITLRALGITP